MSAPDLSRKVVGFREWKTDGGVLSALAVQSVWGRGKQTARCDGGMMTTGFVTLTSSIVFGSSSSGYYTPQPPPEPPKTHEAPSHDCHCGIYAYHDIPGGYTMEPPYGVTGPNQVVGAILAWGTMEVHKTGFRAQYAEIAALAYPDQAPMGWVNKVGALAEDYAIPCVSVSELEAFALTMGDRVPESLFPDLPPEPNPAQKAMAKKNAYASSLNALHEQYYAGFPPSLATQGKKKRGKRK